MRLDVYTKQLTALPTRNRPRRIWTKKTTPGWGLGIMCVECCLCQGGGSHQAPAPCERPSSYHVLIRSDACGCVECSLGQAARARLGMRGMWKLWIFVSSIEIQISLSLHWMGEREWVKVPALVPAYCQLVVPSIYLFFSCCFFLSLSIFDLHIRDLF